MVGAIVLSPTDAASPQEPEVVAGRSLSWWHVTQPFCAFNIGGGAFQCFCVIFVKLYRMNTVQ